MIDIVSEEVTTPEEPVETPDAGVPGIPDETEDDEEKETV